MARSRTWATRTRLRTSAYPISAPSRREVLQRGEQVVQARQAEVREVQVGQSRWILGVGHVGVLRGGLAGQRVERVRVEQEGQVEVREVTGRGGIGLRDERDQATEASGKRVLAANPHGEHGARIMQCL